MKRKLTITLPPIQEPKQFRCDVCEEHYDYWRCYIEGKKRKLCLDCPNRLTPPKARLGWRQYEHFNHRDASSWGDIHHLAIMLTVRRFFVIATGGMKIGHGRLLR